MKVSIVSTYYNRRPQLIAALISLENYIKDRDVEIIIIDDASRDDQRIDDIQQLFPNLNIVYERTERENNSWKCPVISLNKSISMCTGDAILLQGAEIYHAGDIIGDIIKRIKPNDYIAYAGFCLNWDNTNKLVNNPYNINFTHTENDGMWGQHSIYCPNFTNLCVAIMRDDLLDLGGFDERYARGTDFGDNDFILRVRRKGMNIIAVDEPMAYHLEHERGKMLSSKSIYLDVEKNGQGYKVKNRFL